MDLEAYIHSKRSLDVTYLLFAICIIYTTRQSGLYIYSLTLGYYILSKNRLLQSGLYIYKLTLKFRNFFFFGEKKNKLNMYSTTKMNLDNKSWCMRCDLYFCSVRLLAINTNSTTDQRDKLYNTIVFPFHSLPS